MRRSIVCVRAVSTPTTQRIEENVAKETIAFASTFVRILSVTTGLVVLCASLGCNSTPTIHATALPLQYRGQDISFRPPLDLSVLARRSLNGDLIYPGDTLDVTIITGAETKAIEPLPYRVSPNGTIDLPLVGPVVVAGKTLTAAEEAIRHLAIERRIYRNPSVSVLLNTRQVDLVRVVGAVQDPGVHELPRAGSDLLAAIVAAGGLTEDADTVIEVRHPLVDKSGLQLAGFADEAASADSPQSVRVDLVEAMSGNVGDLSLRDGSVVMVRKHIPQTIYVFGLVPNDGEFELPKDQPLRVTQAVALAGGRQPEIADKVHVIRYVPGRSEPIVIEVSMKEAKSDRGADPILIAGDVVSVEETPVTFVVDFLRNFFRVGFSSAIPGF